MWAAQEENDLHKGLKNILYLYWYPPFKSHFDSVSLKIEKQIYVIIKKKDNLNQQNGRDKLTPHKSASNECMLLL